MSKRTGGLDAAVVAADVADGQETTPAGGRYQALSTVWLSAQAHHVYAGEIIDGDLIDPTALALLIEQGHLAVIEKE